MKNEFSPVYLDDAPVTLMGDEARPPLSRIVRAGGKRPSRVDIVVLASRSDKLGHALDPEEIIDRTAEPTKPIYLRSAPKPGLPPPSTANDSEVVAEWSFIPGAGLTLSRSVGTPTMKPNADRVIAQLGADPLVPEVTPKVLRETRRAEAQATAEAGAEERQEEDREQADNLQDEKEEREESEDGFDGAEDDESQD